MESTATFNEIQLKNIYKIYFLCFVVLGLYYPSIFSQFNSIDDAHIITYLEDTDSTLLQILLPGKSHYYRPVIWLTYFFDKYVWGLEPSFMHLENIIIHNANVILVYLVADKIAGVAEKRIQLPFLSAILFAAHPINTEAICWVAGRTDPLATFFILAAAYCLAGSANAAGSFKALLPAAFIFIGCLAKETAFFFFPVAYLGVLKQKLLPFNWKERFFPWQGLFRPTLPYLFFSLAYLYLRQSALPSGDRSVSILMTQQISLIKTGITALTAFGFYVKKLVLPLPLNFAIVSYNHNYVWLGIAALVLLWFLLWQKNVYYHLLGSSLFLIMPAVIVAVKPIAWTPVAERYLYAPAAFFTIALGGILCQLLQRRYLEYFLPPILIVLIISCSFVTVQRNLIWQDNYLLYRDAVSKSPQFAKIRNEYGVALAGRGENKEASRQLKTGNKIDPNYHLAILNLANIKFREGKNHDAIEILTRSYKDKKDADSQILKLLARVNESNLNTSASKADRKKIALDLIDTYQNIYAKGKEPYVAYRAGQLLLFIGEPQKAAPLFAIAAKEAPDDAFYKQAAKKLADKLRNK